MAEQGEQESTEHTLEDQIRRQEAGPEQNMQRPFVISKLQPQGQDTRRRFTSMDVEGGETRSDDVEKGIKENKEGGLCEDCNLP